MYIPVELPMKLAGNRPNGISEAYNGYNLAISNGANSPSAIATNPRDVRFHVFSIIRQPPIEVFHSLLGTREESRSARIISQALPK